MSAKTGIEWTDATWNPIRGCSRVSEGCRNCYAEAVAARFSGPGQPYYGLARLGGEARWTGAVALVEKALDLPLRWRQPRRVFVNSMSDLFHESVPDEWIDRIFAVMALGHRHTFQVLTKRAERMREYLSAKQDAPLNLCPEARIGTIVMANRNGRYGKDALTVEATWEWPLPNVWLGVSCEDQQRADERIAQLINTPAAVRWVSAEPLLGPIDFFGAGSRGAEDGDPCAFSALTGYDGGTDNIPGLDWVVVGGESGPGARPMDIAWARSIVEQCKAAGVACFVKQLGARPWWQMAPCGGCPDCGNRDCGAAADLKLADRKGGDPSDWPIDLRVREWPR